MKTQYRVYTESTLWRRGLRGNHGVSRQTCTRCIILVRGIQSEAGRKKKVYNNSFFQTHTKYGTRTHTHTHHACRIEVYRSPQHWAVELSSMDCWNINQYLWDEFQLHYDPELIIQHQNLYWLRLL